MSEISVLEMPAKVQNLPPKAEEEEGNSSISLKTDFSPENRQRIAQLQNKEIVGIDQYGESSVNKFQEGMNTPEEHEKAQKLAYQAYQEKISKGLVDPGLIAAEMCLKLGFVPEIQSAPQTYEEIPQKVNGEIALFAEKAGLRPEEVEILTREVAEFTKLYSAAYGKENIIRAFELVRDNARKLMYQHMIDKTVFVGSDHGLRHIINGNIRFAKQMIESLRNNGVVVSAKDEIIIHQVMIDHDLGYTVGAALAPRGFNATADHPLAGAGFVEDNKDYYINRFGEEGYRAIFDSVLNHSYPRLEYQSNGQEVVHAGLIRGITSTVDSLGVTVETKTPEFFWNQDVMRVLLKIKLFIETSEDGKLTDDYRKKYKDELMAIAAKGQNQNTAGYQNAIENFFNEFTVDNVLGQYTGVVRRVQVEQVPLEEEGNDHTNHGHEGEEKRFRVLVEMTPTGVFAALGNLFGDKAALRSFKKAIKDLGLPSSEIEAHVRASRKARIRGEKPPELEVVSKDARLLLGSELLEKMNLAQLVDILDAQKIQTIAGVFHEVEMLSTRIEINELLYEVGERGTEVIPEIQARFESSISSKMSAQEMRELNELFINLSDYSSTREKDSAGNDITVSQAARLRLKGFRTAKEKEFLGI